MGDLDLNIALNPPPQCTWGSHNSIGQPRPPLLLAWALLATHVTYFFTYISSSSTNLAYVSEELA